MQSAYIHIQKQPPQWNEYVEESAEAVEPINSQSPNIINIAYC